MSFQLAKTIANVEQKIAAKATSANRRGLLIQDAGTYKSVAINLHACKDALTAAYEWFLQSYLRPLYTEILFAFPEGIGGTIRLPLLNIRFPNFLTVGNYSSFKGAVSPTGVITGGSVVAGSKIGVANDRIKLATGANLASVYHYLPDSLIHCSAISTVLSNKITTVDDFLLASPEVDETFHVLSNEEEIQNIAGAEIEVVGREIEIKLPAGRTTAAICVGGYAVPTVCIPVNYIAKNDGTVELLAEEWNSIFQPVPSFTQLRLLLYYEEIVATAVLIYIMGMDDARTAGEMQRLQAMIAAAKQQLPDSAMIFTSNAN